MLGHDEFRFVIYDYGSTLAILLLLVVAGRTHGVAGHRAYIASGILVSIAAAAVQQSGVRLHQHFNHNDLMHVVQMGGVWLLYKGGARLRDAGGSLMTVSRRDFLKASSLFALQTGTPRAGHDRQRHPLAAESDARARSRGRLVAPQTFSAHCGARPQQDRPSASPAAGMRWAPSSSLNDR